MKQPAATVVLVVDDDAVIRDIYRLALERAGHEVVTASDGAAGVEAARQAAPAFIFLDIRMPKMDGIECLRRLRTDSATRQIPVVMLSNYDEPGLVAQSLELGATEYLVKVSIDPRDLPGIVGRWVGKG